ncbi:hypothetical protein PYCC9005_003513 [Savitreella phatthalungensis]
MAPFPLSTRQACSDVVLLGGSAGWHAAEWKVWVTDAFEPARLQISTRDGFTISSAVQTNDTAKVNAARDSSGDAFLSWYPPKQPWQLTTHIGVAFELTQASGHRTWGIDMAGVTATGDDALWRWTFEPDFPGSGTSTATYVAAFHDFVYQSGNSSTRHPGVGMPQTPDPASIVDTLASVSMLGIDALGREQPADAAKDFVLQLVQITAICTMP